MKNLLKKIVTSILIIESKLILKKYQPEIIAVTGNIGKTSTKDAIFTVLSSQIKDIRKSEKSFNSEIGIPLTILGEKNAWSNPLSWAQVIIKGFFLILVKQNYPKILILEVGADKPNDIKDISAWIHPDIVVVTAFQKTPVHVENFKDRESLIREKRYLVEAVKPHGIMIMNFDDADAKAMVLHSTAEHFGYGESSEADIRLESSEMLRGGNEYLTTFSASYHTDTYDSAIYGSIGTPNVYAALAAVSVAVVKGFDFRQAMDAVKKYVSLAGRMRIIPGLHDSMIIDDTYNASPLALESAIHALSQMQVAGEKIAVLGDMKELGAGAEQIHFEIGVKAARTISTFVLVGALAEKIGAGALSVGFDVHHVHVFENASKAGEFLKNTISAGDAILVKGSQSMRMEKAVEQIIAGPEYKKLLVRQENEWKRK